MLDNALNQPSNFRTKNWAEINDESRGTYNTGAQIKFKTTMSKSILCDYSDAYVLVQVNVTVNNTAADDAATSNINKKVMFNTQVDPAKDIDIAIPMYNLIEYNENYSKTSGSLWQYCKDIPAVNNNADIVDFNLGYCYLFIQF